MKLKKESYFSQSYTISNKILKYFIDNNYVNLDSNCLCPEGLKLNDCLIEIYETRSSKIAESIIKIAPEGKKVLAIAFDPSINSTEEDSDEWEKNIRIREKHNREELIKYKEFLSSNKTISYNKKWKYIAKTKTKTKTKTKNENENERERFENLDTTRRNLLISILKLFNKNSALKNDGLEQLIVSDLIPFRTKKEKNAYRGEQLKLTDNFDNIKKLCKIADIIIPCWGKEMNSYFGKDNENARKKFQKSFDETVRPVLNNNSDKIYFLNKNIPVHPASQNGLSLIKMSDNPGLILSL